MKGKRNKIILHGLSPDRYRNGLVRRESTFKSQSNHSTKPNMWNQYNQNFNF